jgi:hypothetical protein
LEERTRDKHLLAKSIGWGRGLNHKATVLMKKDAEEIMRHSPKDNQPDESSPKVTVT